MAQLGTTRRAAMVYLLLVGLQRGVSLLILPFVSHAMTPAQYGAAAILTTSTVVLVTIGAAPLEQLVFRASARGGDDAPALLRVAGTYCYVVMPLVLAVVAAGVALFLPELFGMNGTIWAIELLAVGFQPAASYFALPYVRARQDLRRFVWLALTSVVLIAVSKLALVVVWGLGVEGWAISDLVSAVLSAVLAVALVRRPRARITTAHIREVLSFSIPLIPHRASFWALASLSRPALAMVSSLAQVGLLSLGLSLASVANMVLAEINQAVLPHYSRETFPAPTDETRTLVRWQLVLTVTVPALVGGGVALAGRWFIAEPYWPAFALTGVLLCGQVAYGLYLIPMNYLVQAAGLPKFSAVASVAGAVVIMIGIFVAGRRFGAVGVAYATTTGFVVMALVGFILTRIFKLDIRWQAWSSCLPEMIIATASLVLSVASLSCPVGSAAASINAALCILFALSAYVMVLRRRTSDSHAKHRISTT